MTRCGWFCLAVLGSREMPKMIERDLALLQLVRQRRLPRPPRSPPPDRQQRDTWNDEQKSDKDAEGGEGLHSWCCRPRQAEGLSNVACSGL